MRSHWMLAALLGLMIGSPLRSETLASAGSEKISRDDFAAALQDAQTAQKRELSLAERKALLQSMLNQRLLVLEARRLKLDRDPAYKAAVAEFERRSLVQALLSREVDAKAAVSEAQAKEFYGQNPGLFDAVDLSQIVVAGKADDAAAEKKAQALAAMLKRSPNKFAATAKKDSDDAKSKARGGDVGTLRRGMLLPELEKAAFEAKAGTVVGPVRTQFGWHILYVRDRKRLTWEQAGGDLQSELQRLKAQQLQGALLERVSKSVKTSLKEDQL